MTSEAVSLPGYTFGHWWNAKETFLCIPLSYIPMIHALSCGTQYQGCHTWLRKLQGKMQFRTAHSCAPWGWATHSGHACQGWVDNLAVKCWQNSTGQVQMRFPLVFFGGSQSGQTGTVFQEMTEVISPTVEALLSQISSLCSTEALDLPKERHCQSILNYRYICFFFSNLALRNYIWTVSD